MSTEPAAAHVAAPCRNVPVTFTLGCKEAGLNTRRERLLALVALLVVIVCVVPAIVAMASRAWILAIALALVASVALRTAIRIDRHLVQASARQKLEQLQHLDDAEVTVAFNWTRWCLSMGVPLALVGVSLGATLSAPHWSITIETVLATLFAVTVIIGIWVACSVLRTGFLMRLDSWGIRHCGFRAIPWGDVQSLSLKDVGARSVAYVLVVALHPDAALAWPGRLREGSEVWIPLSPAAGDIDLLLQQVQLMAARAGVPLGRGWPSKNALVSHFLRKAGDLGWWQYRLAHTDATDRKDEIDGTRHG